MKSKLIPLNSQTEESEWQRVPQSASSWVHVLDDTTNLESLAAELESLAGSTVGSEHADTHEDFDILSQEGLVENFSGQSDFLDVASVEGSASSSLLDWQEVA